MPYLHNIQSHHILIYNHIINTIYISTVITFVHLVSLELVHVHPLTLVVIPLLALAALDHLFHLGSEGSTAGAEYLSRITYNMKLYNEAIQLKYYIMK